MAFTSRYVEPTLGAPAISPSPQDVFEVANIAKSPTVSLNSLPSEVLEVIISSVLGGPQRISIHIWRPRNDSRITHLTYSPQEPITRMLPLMATTKRLRAQTIATISRECSFEGNTVTFRDVPLTFGLPNCTLVRRLRLHSYHDIHMFDESIWPGLMDMMRTRLPSLGYLEICIFHSQVYLFMGLGNEDRGFGRSNPKQEATSVVLKFAFFLKHPQLNRVILPTKFNPSRNNSGKTVLILDSGGNERACADQFIVEDDCWTKVKKITIEGSLLNTALIRRIKKFEMANVPIEYFTFPEPKSQSTSILSPVAQTPSLESYKILEDQAYLPEDLLAKHGWVRREHDDLVSHCGKLQNMINSVDQASKPQTQEDINTLSHILSINELQAENKRLKDHTREIEKEMEEAWVESQHRQEKIEGMREEMNTCYQELYSTRGEVAGLHWETKQQKGNARREKARKREAKREIRGWCGEDYLFDMLSFLYGEEHTSS